MSRVLITDASHGLGVEFARQYAADGWEVFAVGQPGKAAVLNTFGKCVTVLPYDVTDDASLPQLTDEIGTTPLDVVIIHAAANSGGDRFVSGITREDWTRTISVNTFAPAKLAIALRGNLERGAMKKLVGISSVAASIGSGDVSAHYAFRASKAALNSIWHTFSVEWRPREIICLLLCPEITPTHMTGYGYEPNPVLSVTGMRRRIAVSTLADTGRFFSFDGSEVPW